MNDLQFMAEAIELAKRGSGRVSPNPLVGAIIVKKGKVVGRGYHKRLGGAHAEVNALKQAGKKARGATMYVNLEPCCCYGKTPPCTEAIIRTGLVAVVVGIVDPNPRVKGMGIGKLKAAGIKVKNLNLKEAERLNEFYIKHMKTNMPFVILKIAMSADGKISWGGGRRRKISGKESWQRVHKLRNDVDSVLIGVNTVLLDNPKLTCRIKNGSNPIRVIVDSKARIPLNARVLNEAGKAIVVCTKKAPKKRIEKLIDNGIGVLIVKENKNRVSLKELMKELGKIGIQSVLIEGGASINASAIKAGIADRLLLTIAPKIIGKGLDAFNGEKIMKKIRIERVERVGADLLIECYPN